MYPDEQWDRFGEYLHRRAADVAKRGEDSGDEWYMGVAAALMGAAADAHAVASDLRADGSGAP